MTLRSVLYFLTLILECVTAKVTRGTVLTYRVSSLAMRLARSVVLSR
jgi:hypothetical protein